MKRLCILVLALVASNFALAQRSWEAKLSEKGHRLLNQDGTSSHAVGLALAKAVKHIPVGEFKDTGVIVTDYSRPLMKGMIDRSSRTIRFAFFNKLGGGGSESRLEFECSAKVVGNSLQISACKHYDVQTRNETSPFQNYAANGKPNIVLENLMGSTGSPGTTRSATGPATR